MKKLVIVLFSAVVFGGVSFSQSLRVLNAGDYEKALKAGNDVILLDVRTAREYSQGHLAGAQSIDFYQSDFVERLKKLDHSKPVFVYCEAGSRSNATAHKLINLGFRNVIDLRQGIRAWIGSGRPVAK